MARPLKQREHFRAETDHLRRMMTIVGTDARLPPGWRNKAARLITQTIEHFSLGEKFIQTPAEAPGTESDEATSTTQR